MEKSGMTTALLVIDVQEAILQGSVAPTDWSLRLQNINRLIANARIVQAAVIFIQHHGGHGHRLHPSQPGFALHHALARETADQVIGKTECDSFFETDLDAALKAKHIKSLVVCGCWSNYCVDTTCRRAVSMGYGVQLASDAHACGESAMLSAEQIIAHRNDILDGLSAGACEVSVRLTAEVQWA
jgi:nicotinamidase-related amidase